MKLNKRGAECRFLDAEVVCCFGCASNSRSKNIYISRASSMLAGLGAPNKLGSRGSEEIDGRRRSYWRRKKTIEKNTTVVVSKQGSSVTNWTSQQPTRICSKPRKSEFLRLRLSVGAYDAETSGNIAHLVFNNHRVH